MKTAEIKKLLRRDPNTEFAVSITDYSYSRVRGLIDLGKGSWAARDYIRYHENTIWMKPTKCYRSVDLSTIEFANQVIENFKEEEERKEKELETYEKRSQALEEVLKSFSLEFEHRWNGLYSFPIESLEKLFGVNTNMRVVSLPVDDALADLLEERGLTEQAQRIRSNP